MTFKEGYKKVLENIPNEMFIYKIKGQPYIELKLNKEGMPTGEIYFCLLTKDSPVRMNIKVDQNANLLEAYPICSKEEPTKWGLSQNDIISGTYPYLSLDSEGNPTDIYYMSTKSKLLTKIDNKGKVREYTPYYIEVPNMPGKGNWIFQNYKCTYVATYHKPGHPEDPSAYLIGFHTSSPNYKKLKANLFQLIK